MGPKNRDFFGPGNGIASEACAIWANLTNSTLNFGKEKNKNINCYTLIVVNFLRILGAIASIKKFASETL